MQPNNLISKSNSLIFKGGGILLMLFHHLFYSPSSTSLFFDYHIHIGSHDIGVVNQLGIYAKLCVAIFVFASGYGLETSYLNKEIKTLSFYKHRFKKLYLNYWFIWLLFVPFGIFVFGRTPLDAYGNHAVVKMILDFFGLLNLTGKLGYNPTWWFYSCIIVLYLAFPLLHKWITNKWLLLLSIGVAVSRLVGLPIITPISNYLLPFLVGMWIARASASLFDRLSVFDTIIAFVVLSVIRNFSNMYCIVDTLLCMTIVVFLYKVKFSNWLETIFVQLGKHSQNIFLFHTFIFLYWFREQTYITRNPLIIFIQLTVVCYLISVVIELIKQKIGFYKLCK